MATEWIGVAEVAAELNLSERRAWELVRRLGVPLIGGPNGRMSEARFLRERWEASRDAAQRPAPARSPRARKAAEPAAAVPKPRKADPKVDKLAALRNA